MVRRGQLVSRKLFKPFLFLWTRRTLNWKPQLILSAKTLNISCAMSQNKLSYSFSRKKYVQNVFLDIQISFIIPVGNALLKVGSFVAEVGNKHGNVKFAKTFFSSIFFPGQVKCIFDKPAQNLSPKKEKPIRVRNKI